MQPLFQDRNEWLKFLAILESWLGTPYRHLQMAKGRGADCTLFIGACYLEAGILTAVTYDYYPRDWHIHTDEEVVLESLVRHFTSHLTAGLRAERIEDLETPLMRGDFLCLKQPERKVTHHAAVYLGENRIIHALTRLGVTRSDWEPYWSRRLTRIFRLKKE